MILRVLIALLALWIHRQQEQTISYLREENRLLKAKLQGRRLHLTDSERRRLAVLAHPIDRKHLKDVATITTADTLQRWYRRLVAQQGEDTTHHMQPGRPPVSTEIALLAVRMAEENASWGYRRIQGALANLGHHIDKSTVRNILRRHHIDPAPQRRQTGMGWTQFLMLHWEVLAATAFFTEGMETLAQVRTGMLQLGRDLITPCVQLVSLLHHARLGVRTLWLLLWQRLWSVRWFTRPWLVSCDTPWAGVLARRGVGRTKPSRVFSLVPCGQAARLRVVHRVPQERDPPTARWPGLMVTPQCHAYGRSAFGSRLLSTPSVDHNRRLVRSERQQGGSCTDSHQAAA